MTELIQAVTQTVPDTANIVGALGGAGVGGAVILWFAKAMFRRLLKENDEKHAAHEKRLAAHGDELKQVVASFNQTQTRFTETLSDLKTKLAVLEVTVADAKNMRTDIQTIAGRTAVVERHLDKAHERIDNVRSDLKLLTQTK